MKVILRAIIKGKMKGRAFQERKRPYMLSDLTLPAKYLKGKRAAEDQEDGELQTKEECHKL